MSLRQSPDISNEKLVLDIGVTDGANAAGRPDEEGSEQGIQAKDSNSDRVEAIAMISGEEMREAKVRHKTALP